MKTREVKCIDGNNEPSIDCDEPKKPYTREACNLRECPQGEQPFDYKGINSLFISNYLNLFTSFKILLALIMTLSVI